MFGLGYQELLLVLIIVGIPLAIIIAVSRWRRAENDEAGLVGIRGWLWLVGIGVCLTPFYLFEAASNALDNGDKTTLVLSAALSVWAIVNAVLFFKRNRHFSKAWIGLNVLSVVLIVLGSLADSGSMKPEVFGPLFWTIVWLGYMLRSRRVKATFVQ